MRASTSRGACLLVDGPISRPDGPPALEGAVDPGEASPAKPTATASVPAFDCTGRSRLGAVRSTAAPRYGRSDQQIRARSAGNAYRPPGCPVLEPRASC